MTEASALIDRLKEHCTIVVFGDSISRGVVFDETKQRHSLLLESYANIVKEQLRAAVVNAAKFGSTILEGLQRFQNDVLQKRPDIVLIEFGGNDCDFAWDDVAQDPTGPHQPKTDRGEFARRLSDLIARLNELRIIPVLVTLPPLDPERYLQWVSHNSAEAKENILRFIGAASRIYSWHEQYNAAILRVAEETKTRLIDIRSSFLAAEDYTTLICRDGIHPNREGHRVIAETILQYIRTRHDFLLTNPPSTTAAP
ncbi:MAG: SGNH/GDSL hydrolase family protein [Bacteroidetes bacterium]|nr:MAG: SGNH/GDSL hydrolase family protein [Bacteroidota bacterium]